jgi:C-terminal topoisomerase domain
MLVNFDWEKLIISSLGSFSSLSRSIVNLYILWKYRIEKKLTQIDTKIEKLELDKKVKEDLKTVALGTSKINYLDPRITVAWCKRHEVPIEKVIFLYGFV